jgi:hypothetical protein
MAGFLRSIGVRMIAGRVDVPAPFPGSLISRGTLIVGSTRTAARS